MKIRDLRLVDTGARPVPVAEKRPGMARLLRRIAAIVESGGAWGIDGPGGSRNEREPICAFMLVVFGPDGEPTPFLGGIDGDNWTDKSRYLRLVGDARSALTARRVPPYGHRPKTQDEADAYDALRVVMDDWLDTEQGRAVMERKAAERKAAHEAEFPFLCDCGQRCKSAGGLANHRARSWQHRQQQQ